MYPSVRAHACYEYGIVRTGTLCQAGARVGVLEVGGERCAHERMGDVKAVRFTTVRAVFVLLLLALVLSACGSENGEEGQSGGEGESFKKEEKEKEKSPKQEMKKGEEKEPLQKSAASSAAGKAGGQPTPDAEAVASEAGVPEGQDAQDFDRRVIRNAELGIRVEDVRRGAAEAQQVAAQFGGSVVSSEINQGDDSVSADLVLSVPSERFEESLDELRELGTEITTDTVEGEDVTEEFVDLESRERNLLAAEESLIELYDQSESVNDTLTVLRELTRIRDQIERVQGRIEYLEQRTDFSQITLDIQPAGGATAAWDPAGIASRAWNASLRFLQALANVVISIVAFGWWLVPLLVAGLVWWWRRRNRKGSGSATKDSSQAS